MKKIGLDSWLDVQFISNVKESPSNNKFAYVVSKADIKKDLYEIIFGLLRMKGVFS
jgi:hypothetical protein